jgi:hypothetical protein
MANYEIAVPRQGYGCSKAGALTVLQAHGTMPYLSIPAAASYSSCSQSEVFRVLRALNTNFPAPLIVL